MAEPVATDFDAILHAIQARLMAVLDWPEARVLIDARSDEDADAAIPVADQYLRLKLASCTPDAASVEARGRKYPNATARVQVILRTRIDTDKVNSDDQFLTHRAAEPTERSRGHLVAWGRVWDALLCFQPEDDDGNWLVFEPIKPAEASGPRKPPKGWGQSVLGFTVGFILDLDQGYQ